MTASQKRNLCEISIEENVHASAVNGSEEHTPRHKFERAGDRILRLALPERKASACGWRAHKTVWSTSATTLQRHGRAPVLLRQALLRPAPPGALGGRSPLKVVGAHP